MRRRHTCRCSIAGNPKTVPVRVVACRRQGGYHASVSDILFNCPECEKSLAVDETGVGRVVPCTDCAAAVEVPTAARHFRCPACGYGLAAAGGLTSPTFQCPACREDIAVPAAQEDATEGGTVRVRRDREAPGAPFESATGTDTGERTGPPSRLFRVRPVDAGERLESRRVFRRLWLLVFCGVGLLALLIYMDVIFGVGARLLDASRALDTGGVATDNGQKVALEALDPEPPPVRRGPPSGWQAGTNVGWTLPPSVTVPVPAAAGDTFRSGTAMATTTAATATAGAAAVLTNAPADAALASLRTVYDEQLARLVSAHATNVQDWAASYRTKLNRLRKAMQADGDLDGWVAVGKELARFAAEDAPPVADTTSSVSLAAVMEQSRQGYDTIMDAYSRKILKLGETYVSHLVDMQRDRTRAGSFKGAFRVKTEIERVEKGSAHAAAEFYVAAADARDRAIGRTEDVAAAEQEPVTNRAVDVSREPPKADAVPTAPTVSRGRASSERPGVTFTPLPVKLSGSRRERAYYEVIVLHGASSNRQSRASASSGSTGASSEAVWHHYVAISIRTTSRTHTVRKPRLKIEYFVTGVGPSEGRSSPHRVTVDEVDLAQLDNEWITINCPPFETRRFEQRYEGSAFRRSTTGGERFYGVIVNLLQNRKRSVLEAVAVVP